MALAGTPITRASNAGGVSRSRVLNLYLASMPAVNAATGRCCQHGRRWITATALQVMTLISLVVYCGYAGIRPPSATRDNQSLSPLFYSARPTKRALALYTFQCVAKEARGSGGSCPPLAENPELQRLYSIYSRQMEHLSYALW